MTPSGLIGKSQAAQALRSTIGKVAQANSRVLISGPAGSGKELVARQIHEGSPRARAEFVAISAAGMTPERLDVELFGEEGQDGRPRKIGVFERAHNGTLYLDEISDMPRESRLFANEVLQGAPRMMDGIRGELKELVDRKAAVIRGWAEAGKIAPVDPHHLIFSIWALTQHYADFDVQVRAVLGEGHDPFPEAEAFLTNLYTRLLAPQR